MTPAARIGAAIEILDRILGGTAAEQALTSWARAHRFAGSGDRAAIRDHVFDALRCRRSFVALSGGAESGRALMIGALRVEGRPVGEVFSGEGYAPAPLGAEEAADLASAPSYEALAELVALDCPDWLAPALRDALGEDFAQVMQAMRHRAPVILRANAARGSRADIREALAREGIESIPHPLANHALKVTGNAQKIRNSRAYSDGLVELQDAAPQAAVEALPLKPGMRVLDFCAGGGGKSLAMAARNPGRYVAHDAAPARMRDLPVRARRAGARIEIRDSAQLATGAFDLVLIDVPCSGSGTWRRAPEAKWTLGPERLAELVGLQARIFDTAARHVAPGGSLAYMTCSLLGAENRAQVAAFLARTPGWRLVEKRLYSPLDDGDGFFSALLMRD